MCTCTEKMTFLGKDDHSIVEWGGGHLEECTRPNLTQPLVAYINFEVQKKNFSLEPIFTLYPPPQMAYNSIFPTWHKCTLYTGIILGLDF